jgi:ribosomal-protein-alanine N-acetyltransferase
VRLPRRLGQKQRRPPLLCHGGWLWSNSGSRVGSRTPAGSWDNSLADLAGGTLVCHNDVEPSNVVFRDGTAVALLDFELAAPGRPLRPRAPLATLGATLGCGHLQCTHDGLLRERARYHVVADTPISTTGDGVAPDDAKTSQVRLLVVVNVLPARLDWLEALAQGDDVFSARFDIPVVADWIGFPEALPAAIEEARRRPEDPWGTHLFFDDDGALVGFGGFKGEPGDGEVELGYAVAPVRQGRGIATAVVEELVGRARTSGVRVVSAHTLAEENASTAVLRKSGFTRTAELHDADGDVWRWERALTHSAEPGQAR